MRGTMDIIHPNQPMEHRFVSKVPKTAELEQILGGLPDIIPHWDQHINWFGNLVPALVVANNDYRDPIQPFNYYATAVWHYVSRAAGHPSATRITGPVVILTGDDEFMDSLLQS